MLFNIINYILLQEQGVVGIWRLIELIIVLAAFVGMIWGIYQAFSTKANKTDVDELEKKVDKKVENEDYLEHIRQYEQYKARHEQAHLAVSMDTNKKIDSLHNKFDDFSLKIIDILKDK